MPPQTILHFFQDPNYPDDYPIEEDGEQQTHPRIQELPGSQSQEVYT